MLVQLLSLAVLLLQVVAATQAASQAKHGCQESCGNVTIPYPFGTREGCFYDESFLITCNQSDPFLRVSNIVVLNISLEGQLRVKGGVAYDCYHERGNRVNSSRRRIAMTLSNFPISYTKNVFTAVGCDTYAYITGSLGRNYATGCMSLCHKIDEVIDGSCSGIGCCQTSIPRGVRNSNLSVGSYYNHSGILNFNPCGFAFLVEHGWYNFSSVDLHPNNLSILDQKFPVVLDWAIGDEKCKEAKKNKSTYVCGNNSRCYDSDNGPGYRCNCSQGYEGNPYLPNGCQDIDECSKPELHQCTNICSNTRGSYTCSCPKWYHGDGRKDGHGCISNQILIKITFGITTGILVMFVIAAFVFWGFRKRKISKVRKNYFEQNGGTMLQELLLTSENSTQKAQIFTEKELEIATSKFSETNVLGEGGYGTVYRGTLEDGTLVAVKKSKVVDLSQIRQFVTEVKILSQIDHPNVVKLLGCSLETPVPLLVYEFIPNNTLDHHLHHQARVSPMPWHTRLRIATETAQALAHMHSTTQIIHRDIKSSNILLDHDYTAKVSDFGISKFVPAGKTHLTTLVQGTFGYIDPEYFHSGNLTEKSDVYSFGVVLVELLTGEKAVSWDRPEKERSLAMYFLSSSEEDQLVRVLDERVRREGDIRQLNGAAELAQKCLKLAGEKRPTMEEVKDVLQALMRNFENNSPIIYGSTLDDETLLLLSDV